MQTELREVCDQQAYVVAGSPTELFLDVLDALLEGDVPDPSELRLLRHSILASSADLLRQTGLGPHLTLEVCACVMRARTRVTVRMCTSVLVCCLHSTPCTPVHVHALPPLVLTCPWDAAL